MLSSIQERKQFRNSAVIHESLDRLQGVIAAGSLSQVLERIESACQKLDLKYNAQVSILNSRFLLCHVLRCQAVSSLSQGHQVYISAADLFYVEIQCDSNPANRGVREVKVVHSSQPSSVSSMAQALRLGDVQLFMGHIKGFMDMYNAGSEQ